MTATTPHGPHVAASAIPPEELDQLTDGIVTALKSVYDRRSRPTSTSSA